MAELAEKAPSTVDWVVMAQSSRSGKTESYFFVVLVYERLFRIESIPFNVKSGGRIR